jgi:hypothetical protein
MTRAASANDLQALSGERFLLAWEPDGGQRPSAHLTDKECPDYVSA